MMIPTAGETGVGEFVEWGSRREAEAETRRGLIERVGGVGGMGSILETVREVAEEKAVKNYQTHYL